MLCGRALGLCSLNAVVGKEKSTSVLAFIVYVYSYALLEEIVFFLGTSLQQ